MAARKSKAVAPVPQPKVEVDALPSTEEQYQESAHAGASENPGKVQGVDLDTDLAEDAEPDEEATEDDDHPVDVSGLEAEEEEEEIDMNMVGIDAGATGQYEMITTPVGFDPHNRVIRIGNVNMEHVDTDQYGRWLYRKQPA